MTSYSVAEAKNSLSELIDRALKGEGVVITRHGTPVVEIKAVAELPRPINEEDIEWLRAHRVRAKPGAESPLESLLAIRNENDR